MEDRKRRMSPVGSGGGTAAQKRKLSSYNSSSSNNVAAMDSEAAGDGNGTSVDAGLGLEEGFLETFQKAALHRQMLGYKRDSERISSKAEKLEDDWRESQTRLLAVEECWKQLTRELKAILGDSEQDTVMTNGHIDDQEPQAALTQRLHETKQLFASLAKRSSTSNSTDDLSVRHQTLSAELIESRSSYSLLQAVVERTQDELDSTLESLRQVERQLERERSSSVRKLNKQAHGENKEDVQKGSTTASAATSPSADLKGSSMVKKEEEGGAGGAGINDEIRDVLEGSSGLTRTEIEELQQQAEMRLKETEELRAEKLALMLELDGLKVKMKEIPPEVVDFSAPFQLLRSQIERLEQDAAEADTLHSKLQTEFDVIKEKQITFRTSIEKEHTDHSLDLNKKLSNQQADLVRLRGERDIKTAELQEIKAKENERGRHAEQMRILAESRQSRIAALTSEIYRLRMKLAAEDGDSALVEQLAEAAEKAKEPEDNESKPLPEEVMLHDLQTRLEKAELLTKAYREQLATLSELAANDPELDIAENMVLNEAKALKDLEEANGKLEKLQELLGEDGQADHGKLLMKAEQAEEEAKKLEAKVKAAEMSTNMLISEITRLSETWDTLNTQNHSKILELAQYDIRLERAAGDKAKANQKYFASEREKETMISQIGINDKVLKAQKVAIEKLEEEKRTVEAKLAGAEKEISEMVKARATHEKEIKTLAREAKDEKYKTESASKAANEAKRLLESRTKEYEGETNGKRKAEQQITKLEKDLEKWKKKASQATAAANGQGRYVETDAKETSEENVLLKRMLKCSSCQQRFKSHTITRCYHMFCKECIDARLETRQRKCPSCSVGFGSQDVQQVYF